MGAFTQWWRARRRHAAGESSEAAFDAVFATAAVGIAVTDRSNRFVRVNPAMERFLGYPPGELIGRSIQEVTHPEDYPAHLTFSRQLERGERDGYRLEKRYLRKDGSTVRGRLTVAAVRNPADPAVSSIGMIEDVTEQHRIKEQLDSSLQQLESINRRLKLYIERAPLACIVGGPDDIVREWNPAAERMFGYTAEEAIGRSIYELIATSEGAAARPYSRPDILEGRAYPNGIVIENRRKDGSRLHCQWHFATTRSGAEADSDTLAFGIDVTARLAAEKERRVLDTNLRQAQKMQSLGTFAGGIAHDFNNILLAISGNARLAIEELPADHPAQRSLVEVTKAAVRASSIVNQILMFSRREESPLEPLDLRDIVEESLNLLRATFPPRISLQTHFAAALPAVRGDPAQLHQVMLNLLTNAAHAMQEQGDVLAVELEPVAIDEEFARSMPTLQPGPHVRITVRDTGKGMSPRDMERIFEPFFTTKPRGQGTGLGLSVVHGIVAAHRGGIDVDSSPGKGSTFRVYLPTVLAKSEVPSPPVEPERGRGRGQRILYIDDEEPLVYLLTRVLQRLGYRVCGFTEPQAALAEFRADPAAFDAVVTDLSMPEISGDELARLILQLRPEIPVVMTSGYVSAEARERARRAGVRELVLKPNTVEALGEVLHRVLNEGKDADRTHRREST